jgi:hypothetical protein
LVRCGSFAVCQLGRAIVGSGHAECLRLIAEAMVPGMAAAIIRDDGLDRYVCCGTRDAQAAAQVDEHTVFDTASLSKPVFAHAVLQLADNGYLSLDAPLDDHLPRYVPADDRAASITPRHVLSHSGGLPNWRNADLPLKTYFEPGSQFSYSGEGFLHLQKAVEAITREMLSNAWFYSPWVWFDRALPGKNASTQIEPIRTTPSGDRRLAANPAKPMPQVRSRQPLPNSPVFCWLYWMGRDCSRKRPGHGCALISRSRTPGLRTLSNPPATSRPVWPGALAGGLEPASGTFFHWGDNGAYKAFTIGSMQNRNALLCFLKGASGLSIMPELIAAFMPGDHPFLAWLDYGRHDAPVRRLLRAARAQGVHAVWQEV